MHLNFLRLFFSFLEVVRKSSMSVVGTASDPLAESRTCLVLQICFLIRLIGGIFGMQL